MKKVKKDNLIFLFVILLSLESYAQSMLKGRITDSRTNPLPGANIYIHELNKGTVADRNGTYLIDNIPDGKFRIQYSFVGFSGEVRTVFFEGKTVTLDVRMNETAIETKEVVISGGYNATQHENAVNIDILKLNSHETKLPEELWQSIPVLKFTIPSYPPGWCPCFTTGISAWRRKWCAPARKAARE
ncbi:MAG: carboxypeptidase-like regulatory domain-containing protein [Bacteroidales bacterium]|nr:carboxypeptidase-like regulatory domain-containing protein [Bacteroidales bacterium]